LTITTCRSLILRLINIFSIDFRQEHIYWTEYDAGKIKRANLDGSMVLTLLERPQVQHPGRSIYSCWLTLKI